MQKMAAWSKSGNRLEKMGQKRIYKRKIFLTQCKKWLHRVQVEISDRKAWEGLINAEYSSFNAKMAARSRSGNKLEKLGQKSPTIHYKIYNKNEKEICSMML